MKSASNYIYILITIVILSTSCKKTAEAPGNATNRQITSTLINSSIVGKWKFQSENVLYNNQTLLDMEGYDNGAGKDTFSGSYNRMFDTLCINKDSSFRGTFESSTDICVISGRWSLRDTTLIFDQIIDSDLRNGKTLSGSLNQVYWFSGVNKKGELVFTTPNLFLINDCSSFNYVTKYQILFSRYN